MNNVTDKIVKTADTANTETPDGATCLQFSFELESQESEGALLGYCAAMRSDHLRSLSRLSDTSRKKRFRL